MLDEEALAALGLGFDGALGWNKLPGGGGGGAAGSPFDGAAAALAYTLIHQWAVKHIQSSHLVITSDQA